MSWSAEEFEREVGDRFAFLIGLGFAQQPMESDGREFSISFVKPTAEIIVACESGSPPFVTLAAPVPPETERRWWSRYRFGLHELVQELTGPEAVLPDTLEGESEALRRFGDEVLHGRFDVLFKRQGRLGNAVESNRG